MKALRGPVALSLAVVLSFLLAACGGGGAASPAASTPAASAGVPSASAKPSAAAPSASVAGKPAASGATAAAKPYAGTTLRFLAANHPWTDAIKPLLPDFEQQTGIKINMESYGEDQLTQKLTTEFTAGNSNVDVFMQRPLQEGRLYAQNKWYADLNPYVKDASKTPSSYDIKDFQSGAMDTETVNGVLTGIPIVVEQEVLYYRKDLLQQAGLQVPKTLDDLQAAAQKLTDKSKGQYGFVARGQRSPAVTQFASFLYSFGGDWENEQTHQATLDTPEALQAFKFYGDLLRNYGPPGTENMSWPQAVAVFAQGKVALYTDSNAIYQNILDPSKSQVADKTGVATFPAGPKGDIMYNIPSWGLSLNASAPHKDAAWAFIEWATSQATVLKTQGQGAVPGARASVWSDAQGKAKFPAGFVDAVNASKDGRGYDRPRVVDVGKARDIVGTVIDTGIEGGNVDSAAKTANQEFQQLLDSENKH